MATANTDQAAVAVSIADSAIGTKTSRLDALMLDITMIHGISYAK
jgi:hypothetical protein